VLTKCQLITKSVVKDLAGSTVSVTAILPINFSEGICWERFLLLSVNAALLTGYGLKDVFTIPFLFISAMHTLPESGKLDAVAVRFL
jgi:hypothetical protein